MYQKVSTDLNFVNREKDVEKFWRENDIFRKSTENRKEGKTYTFYDGPPTANGKPHIGHVLTRVIKDMIPRYRTMKGHMVPRKAGWDTHGLPVELEVEKLLGLDGKEQIEEYGLDPFICKCKESVWKYKGMWEDFSATVGFWADMDDPYVTYHDDYIESEWWALKEIWKKDLLYKGFKIVPYCPRCGTPLSSHEVAQGYRAVKERSAIVRFRVKAEDAYFLAWTTTPWTLPSNLALCVNPDEVYVKVKAADGYTYYMAQALLDKVLGKLGDEETGKAAYEVLETYIGKELEYKEYEPLFACAGEGAARQNKKAHYVTCDSYVTMTDGTGIVHIAPAFGEDDAQVGRKYGLPFVQFVDGKGNMTQETSYAGMFVKDADPEILKDLDREGKLFDAPKFEHDYPFCWRCDTPLIYYARESWFIKMTAVKDDLIRNNNTINWIPESIGKGRFGDWLENIQDWGISRNRYWGTPLNVWECECVLAFRREAMKYGYEVVIKELEDEKSLHLNQIVRDNKFDGCMVVGINTENFYYKQLETVDFPCVLIDNYVDNPCISCLSADNFLGMMLIADLLLKAGHEKIGFINGEYDSITSKERLASFVGELTRQNHHFDPSLVFNGDFSEQSGAEGAEELLKKGVSAICCASDSMAVGAIRRLGSLGVRVPEDVSITGFDDIQLADYIVPRLTTVHIDTNGMGARAFGCLLDIMEGGTGIKILEKPRLMERDSVASLM